MTNRRRGFFMCLSIMAVFICAQILLCAIIKEIHLYLGDRRFVSLARDTGMTSANQQSQYGSKTHELRSYNPRTNEPRIFETQFIEPRTNETRPYAARKYTRMKYGPVFILGVVGGNSSANSTWDHFRIYGMSDRKFYGQKRLACCLLYKDGHVILQSDTMSQRWHEIPAPMWNFHASCSNVMHAQGHIPVGLAVTLLSNGTCTEDHVTYVPPYFPVKEPEKIVIGSKLAYGNISAELIIEWVEAMKYIGVDKIVTYYLRSLNTDALNVLRYYASEGVVELYFHEPANEEVYPRVDHFPAHVAQRWNDQTTVIYDSFERESGCRYFAIIDQDEFFFPEKYKTLREMLDQLERVYTNPAGFVIRTQFYYLFWGKRSNTSDTILGSYTTREERAPRFDRRKNFLIPARMALGGARTHIVWPVKDFKMYPLPAEEGYIRHFRYDCRRDNYIECRTNMSRVLDTGVADWAEGFRDKVAKVRKSVLGL